MLDEAHMMLNTEAYRKYTANIKVSDFNMRKGFRFQQDFKVAVRDFRQLHDRCSHEKKLLKRCYMV